MDNMYDMLDLCIARVSWGGSVLYTDPAQHIKPAFWGPDDISADDLPVDDLPVAMS